MAVKRNKNNLTYKQQLFADEYLADPELNATRAAIKSGYSAKTAYSIANNLLNGVELRAYIDSRLQAISDSKIATADEVMRFLTSVVRDETKEDAVIAVSNVDKTSSAVIVAKKTPSRDRVKAAELLARRYSLLTDKIDLAVQGTIIIDASDDMQDT